MIKTQFLVFVRLFKWSFVTKSKDFLLGRAIVETGASSHTNKLQHTMENFELKSRDRLLEGSIFKAQYCPIGKENGSMHSTDL